MGVAGIFKFVLRRLLELFVILALLVLIPNLPPFAKFSQPYSVTPSKPLTGKLSLNNRLDAVELWHQGDFVGPEAFADLGEALYTSLYNGDIVKLTGNHITPIVKFGKPCKASYEESTCGRPLGIQFGPKDQLYAIDAYYGLFRVNVQTGQKERLVGPEDDIQGVRPKTFNSIAVSKNGDIYWTDSSSEFTLEDGLFALLADPSGRLIHYNAKTKKNRVLLDNLLFANGVALSEDETFVVVAETGRSRIHRVYINGPKEGSSNIFIDGLPGLPDNLKADGKGGFLVPLIISRDVDHPALTQSIGPFPKLRKAIARFMGLSQYVLQKIEQYYPNEFCLKAVHTIGHFTSAPKFLLPSRVSLLRVNRDGEIIDSVHTVTGKIGSISEVHVFGNTLYLGSPFNDYIGRISLAKLGWEDIRKDNRAKRAASAETPKPTTTTPKPAPSTTTTTPKPTTTTQKPTTTTQKPTTTTPKPTTTTPKPTTTTPKPTTTTQKPTTTTPKPTTTTSKPTPTTQKSTPPTQKPATTVPPPIKPTVQPIKQQTPPPVKQQTPPPAKQQTPSAAKQQTPPPVKQQTPPPVKQQTPPPVGKVPTEKQQQRKQAVPLKEQPQPAQQKQKVEL